MVWSPSTVLFTLVAPAVTAGLALAAAATVVGRLRAGTVYAGLGRPYVAVCLTVAAVAAAYAGGRLLSDAGPSLISLWLYVVPVPWGVFALRYVGRGGLVTRRRVAAATVVAALTLVGTFPVALGIDNLVLLSDGVTQLVVSLLVLTFLTATFVLCVVVFVSTRRNDALTVRHGLVATTPVVGMIATVQTAQVGLDGFDGRVVAVGLLTVGVCLVVGTTRYDLVSKLPGVRPRGRQAALTETDQAVFVVDADERVVHANAAAETAFGPAATLTDATDADTATLADRDTVRLWTREGHRRFDPRVTPIRNAFDERLGATVTLVDVTDREIRRQRLQVLNRILRHNVRNRLDVVAAHAETADLPAVMDAVDDLRELSTGARRVERLISRDATTPEPTRVDEFVADVVAETVNDSADVTVSVPAVTVTLDRELCRYALRNVLENAAEHAGENPTVAVRGTATETGVRLVVADDGPGVPEAERAVIDAEREDPLAHASSLGLWGTNWALRTLGGSLSFGESDLGGAAVTLELPDRTSDNPDR